MENPFLINLGNNIKTLREINKLSQHQLAKLISVSNVAVSQWEKGIADPKSTNIVALANTFKITTDELLNTQNEFKELDFTFVDIDKSFNNANFIENKNEIIIRIKK